MIRHKRGWRTHVINTEVRSLEDALEVIQLQSREAKRHVVRTAQSPTLRQELAYAKSRSRFLKAHGKISLAPVGGIDHSTTTLVAPPAPRRPDPFKGWPEDRQRTQAIEWYAEGRGAWKPQEIAIRLGVPVRLVKNWLNFDPRI